MENKTKPEHAILEIPKPWDTVTVKYAIELCRNRGYLTLAKRLLDAQDKLPKSWVFDGCSHWFNSYRGHPIYEVCFFHDCEYLVGGTEAQRLMADYDLGKGLVAMTGSVEFSEITFTGVRVGGEAAWKKNFSWGYGYQSEK